MVTSNRELDYMRQAGQIAAAAHEAAFDAARAGVRAAAHEAAFDAARAGVRQCDAMAEVYRVTTSGLPEFGGTLVQIEITASQTL